jgi:dipeptidyl aminopeptidase/acylaminoacyl peptidase
MVNTQKLPYGHWPSPITPEFTGNLREFSELSWGGGGCLLWVERYSNHSSLMAWDPRSGNIKNLSGEISVGGGIMYGGGSYHARRDQIVFIEKGTNQLFLIAGPESPPQQIKTSPHPKASPRLSPFTTDLVYIESDGNQDAIKILHYNALEEPRTLNSKADFYNYLRWHPDGNRLVWISWDQPYLPWDKAQLNLGELKSGDRQVPSLGKLPVCFGGSQTSLIQPEFSPDGSMLAFLSDQSGWWNIYTYDLQSREIENRTHKEADHALPTWQQNQLFFGFSPDSQRIYCIRSQQGFASPWKLELASNTEDQIQLNKEYTWLESLAVHPETDQIAMVASGGRTPPEIIITSPGGEQRIIRKSSLEVYDPGYFSAPKAISWEVPGGQTVHGLFYNPQNPAFQARGKPPLLIIIHSGPTRQKYAEFQPRTQFFTSRGYAVLEVNYRGSTGYGRAYWEALKGQWGILDVEDVYQSAKALTAQGLVDGEKVALLGSSSGGLTVLQLLVKYPGFFKAGISLYGVTNLVDLLKDPPQFERHYQEWLIGDPDTAAKEYLSRSPLYGAERIRTPIAIFQGGRDPIVPQDQAEQIIAALQKNGIPCEYHLYPGEGHGFKKAENLCDFYRKTEAFLQKHVINTEE